MWYDFFRASLVSAHCTSIYVKMATSDGEGGRERSAYPYLGQGQIFIFTTMATWIRGNHVISKLCVFLKSPFHLGANVGYSPDGVLVLIHFHVRPQNFCLWVCLQLQKKLCPSRSIYGLLTVGLGVIYLLYYYNKYIIIS